MNEGIRGARLKAPLLDELRIAGAFMSAVGALLDKLEIHDSEDLKTAEEKGLISDLGVALVQATGVIGQTVSKLPPPEDRPGPNSRPG